MWPSVKLGEVLDKADSWIELEPQSEYKEVTVRLWGRGVTLRRPTTGAEIAGCRRLQVQERQFIVSRIDARNGAFGLISPELDGAVVSNDFPVFNPIQEKLLPEYLGWLSKTRDFVTACMAASEGTTNRVRLKENKFLDIEIPLPSLSEQRRIVAKIERLAEKVKEAHDLQNFSSIELEALLKSARRSLIGEAPQKAWVSLKEAVIDIENGWSPACNKNPAPNGNWGVIKVGAVSFGVFDPIENKELPSSLKAKPEYEIKPGDFLMSRANTIDLVGACALVKETPPRLILCDKVFRFIFHKNSYLDPSYLDHVLKSPALREQIEAASTGTSPTMKNISKAKIMNLKIPLPSLEEQRVIVGYLNNIQSRMNDLKRIRSQVQKELDAMLPSILDRAFKGQL